jgi:hydroxypyruvate isomerase
MSAAGRSKIRHSVSRWCFGGIPLPDLCVAVKPLGIESIELLTIDEIPVVKEHGLTCAMVSGVPGGIENGLNRVENHEAIEDWFAKTAPAIAALGCENVVVFPGNRVGMDDETGATNTIAGLRRLVPILEKYRLRAVLELLNSKVDHPDYMADHTAWGVKVCEGIGSARVKLLYDIYHMQIMEGDVIRTIGEAHPHIGHYHTAGVPGRHEIGDDQELNYPAIVRAIAATGFDGFLGQEFIPTAADPIAALADAIRRCKV